MKVMDAEQVEKAIDEIRMLLHEAAAIARGLGVNVEIAKDMNVSTQEVRPGKWEEQWIGRGEALHSIEIVFVKCSNCGAWHMEFQHTFPYFSKYCPNCGAKMEVE